MLEPSISLLSKAVCLEKTIEGLLDRNQIVVSKDQDLRPEEASVTALLRSQIQDERLKRSSQHIIKLFDSLVPSGSPGLSKESFFECCHQLRCDITDRKDADELFERMDLNNDQYLDASEFELAMRTQSDVEQYFSQAVPTAEIFWAALPRNKGATLFEVMTNLSSPDIETICRAMKEEMQCILSDCIERLRDNREVTSAADSSTSSKFTVCELDAGKVQDYHKGLSGRVGAPELDFEKAMKAEHCTRGGSDFEFTTSNYHITTTPQREWNIVVEEYGTQSHEMGHGRRIPDLKELMMLPVSKRAEVALCEVIALVLYTGPMFMVYNAILRRFPADLYKVFEDESNLFSTTIHALQSGVVKIARNTKIPENLVLYRGLSLRFPVSFYKPDENGCRGFAEWGFMSTTANREVAVTYSGARQGRPTATVLQIKTSSVNRPACIELFSQYRDEREYLWVPLSFMQPEGTPMLENAGHGLLTKVSVMVNLNGSAETIEDMLARKKNAHLKSFESLADDLLKRLRLIMTGSNCVDVIDSVMKEVRDMMVRHQEKNLEQFVNEESFNKLMDEMLTLCKFGTCKLELFIGGGYSAEGISELPVRICRRLHLAQKMQVVEKCRMNRSMPEVKIKYALQACRLKGLILSSVEEVNELDETRLMEAAAEGASVDSLQLLLEAKSDLHATTPKGSTAVCRAAQYGHEHCLSFLLEAKGSPFVAGDVDPTFMASQNGHSRCLNVLLRAGADPCRKRSDDVTPLMLAAEFGHTDCVKQLLDAKADMDCVLDSGVTALMAAVMQRHWNIVWVLVNAGARQDLLMYGKSPLDVALEQDDIYSADLLRGMGVSALDLPKTLEESDGEDGEEADDDDGID